MRAKPQYASLDDLEVLYSERPSRSTPIGGLNPLGLWMWLGVEGSVVCFTLKTWLVLGRVRLHALHVRGITSAPRRAELVGAPDRPEGTIPYLLRSLRLLLIGVPLPRVGEKVRLLKERTTQGLAAGGKPVGTFSLVPSRQKRR